MVASRPTCMLITAEPCIAPAAIRSPCPSTTDTLTTMSGSGEGHAPTTAVRVTFEAASISIAMSRPGLVQSRLVWMTARANPYVV